MYIFISIVVVVLVVCYLYNRYFIKGKWQEVDIGRVTEFIDIINTESSKPGHSLQMHCMFNYSHITKSDKLMKVRREYRKNIKKGEVR